MHNYVLIIFYQALFAQIKKPLGNLCNNDPKLYYNYIKMRKLKGRHKTID